MPDILAFFPLPTDLCTAADPKNMNKYPKTQKKKKGKKKLGKAAASDEENCGKYIYVNNCCVYYAILFKFAV